MRRRDFVFGSLQAAALLTPVLSLRRAASAEPQDLLGFVWVNCCGYPSPDDFFPTGGEQDFSLSPILADFEGLREHMVIVDGIDIRATHTVADGMHGAIVSATKPVDWSADRIRPVDLPRPTTLSMAPDAGGGCCGGGGCC